MNTQLAVTSLPDIETARLPVVYENAKSALAECARIDECQEWADKAEAMASYAKQAKDDSLRKMADRIQARAIRRCQELLKNYRSGHGGDRKSDQVVGADNLKTQRQAALDAGMSDRQYRTALAVGLIPEDEFERMVESETPPTVTELAELGKKNLVDLGSASHREFKAATAALGILRRFADFAEATDPEVAARGMNEQEVATARRLVGIADNWLDRFITNF